MRDVRSVDLRSRTTALRPPSVDFLEVLCLDLAIMAVKSSFQILVLDQLSRAIPGIRSRAMFGGVGIYAGELFFALIADDTLYFKVDASTRPDFEERGMGPFRPFGEEGGTMKYYQLPEDVLEDPEELRPWVERAVAIARQNKARRPPRRRGA
jgi:DNA transformation protein and related proteins